MTLGEKAHHHHHRAEAEGKCTACGAPHLIPNLDFVKNSVTSERASERALLPSGMAVLLMTMMKSRKRRRKESSRASLSLSLSLFDVTEEFVSAELLSFFAFVF